MLTITMQAKDSRTVCRRGRTICLLLRLVKSWSSVRLPGCPCGSPGQLCTQLPARAELVHTKRCFDSDLQGAVAGAAARRSLVGVTHGLVPSIAPPAIVCRYMSRSKLQVS